MPAGSHTHVQEYICGKMGLLLLLLSHFSRVQLRVTPQTEAHKAPPSLGFSRQEHWIGLPFPSPMMKMGLGNIIFFSKLVEGSKIRDDISVKILLVTSERKHEVKHLN